VARKTAVNRQKANKSTPIKDRALAVVWRDTATLVPYARNARTHSPEQVKQIAASIEAFGWTNPVLVDEQDGIVAGHGRVLAALALGRPQCPTITLTGLSEGQRRAYVVADNKLALNAGWNDELLRLEMGELRDLGIDLALTGFAAPELRLLFAAGAKGDPEATPPVPKKPITRPGDIWVMGEHRLLCGDATSADAVTKLLAGARPHLMVTDPPYGISYDPGWRNQPGKLNLKSTTAFRPRNAAAGKVVNDDRSDWTDAWALFPGDVAYVWHGERQGPDLVGHFRAVDFEPRNLIVWAKEGLVISRGHYHPQHEGCWYFVRAGSTARWSGDRKQSTLWKITSNRKNETGHGTQKPLECMARPIRNNSKAGEAVYDPFLGSGTTLIAAETTGRICYGLEIDPGYCDVIFSRWQDFTGKQAKLERDGKDQT